MNVLAGSQLAYASTTIMQIDPGVQWGLTAYNTHISFIDTLYCTSFSYDSFVNTLWYWDNAQVGSNDTMISRIGLSVESANATVHSFNKNGYVEITLSPISGTTNILTLYYPNNYPQTSLIIFKTTTETIQEDKYFRSLTDWNNAQPPTIFLNDLEKLVKIKVKYVEDVVVRFYWTKYEPSTGGSFTFRYTNLLLKTPGYHVPLNSMLTVQGRLLEEKTDFPIVNAIIKVVFWNGTTTEIKTGEDGGFTLNFTSPDKIGRYQIQFEFPGRVEYQKVDASYNFYVVAVDPAKVTAMILVVIFVSVLLLAMYGRDVEKTLRKLRL